MNSKPDNTNLSSLIESLQSALSDQASARVDSPALQNQLAGLAETIGALLKKTPAEPAHPRVQTDEHAERYRNILEKMQESYFETDLQGNITFFNKRTASALDYAEEELLGVNFRRFVTDEYSQIIAETFKRIYETGQAVSRIVWQMIRKSGEAIDVESSADLLRDPTGKPCGFCGISRDVTERIKIEAALRENENLFRMIVENMHDSISLLDLNLNYIYQSPSEIRITGFAPEEITQTPLSDQMTPASYERAQQIIAKELERELSGDPVDPQRKRTFEIEAYAKSGGTVWEEITASFYRDEVGKPIGLLINSRDITDRKKMEEALRESEKRYRMIIENMHDSISTLDMNFNLTYQSPSEIRLSGYTPEEAMRLTPEQTLTPSSLALVKKVIAEEFEKEFSGQPADPHRFVTLELEAYHKDGHTIWTDVKASFNRDENGKPVEIMLVSRDITERKKMELALRDSEKRYRMIVENMHDTIWTTDLNLNYTYQSPSEIRVTGYTAEEVVNIPFDKLLKPESFARVSQMFDEEFKKEFSGEPVDPNRSRTVELEVFHKNGGTVWQEITASFVRDECGKPLEILMVGRNVTERKKMEEALRESEKRYRLIVENMQDTITLLDMDLNYVYQSPSEIRVTGYTPEEIMKIPIERQITPDTYERGLKILAEELEREYSDNPPDPRRRIVWDIESYRKDGSTVWIEETVSFYRDEAGKPIGILFSGRDITERKKAQEERDRLADQLLQAQKMETVGRLAGGVAHDFNNMLNVILGYIDLAKMRLNIENPLYFDLLEIEKAATRSRDLTAQLLAFSRKQVISPRIVDLNERINEAQKTITRLIGEDIDLRFYPGENLWNVKFDPVQIEQVLINLAVNARDAMPQGGKLIIETANIVVDKTFCDAHLEIAPGDYALLSISDTGTGIPREDIPFVFEPFFTTKDVGQGTGLGLATVYGIIKQNEGYISVYSEPQKGSIFKIYLPRTTEAADVLEKAPEPHTSLGSGTILLVEDDEMVLKMVSDMLEALGYMVIASENPLDALSFCEHGTNPIDLVVTDVIMPQMSGKELRDKLIAIRPDIKILFMSGYTSNIIAQHGVLEEGMQFIQKPFSIHLLAEKVKQMIAAN